MKKSISYYTKETLQFFSQPIAGLLREQISWLLLTVAVMESALSASVICIPLYFHKLEGQTTISSYSLIGPELQLPVLLSVYYLVALTTASYFGSLSDKYGRRPLLIVGTLLASISFIPFPLVFSIYLDSITGFIILLISNIVKGLSSAMIAGPIMAMFADLSTEQNHGETMGKFYLARSAGGASGFLLGGFTWDAFGINAFIFFSVIMSFACLLYTFKLYEPRHHIRTTKRPEITDIELNPFKALLDSLKDRQFRNFGIALLAYSCLIGAVSTYAPVIITEATDENIPASTIGIIFLAGAAIYGAVQPALGKMSDEYGRKPFLLIGVFGISLIIVMFTSILLLSPNDLVLLIRNPFSITETKDLEISVGIVLYGVPNLIIVLIIVFLLLCTASFGSVSLGLISDVIKEDTRGREMGLTQSLMTSGTIVGTIVGGGLYGAFGMFGILFFCFVLSIVAALVIVLFVYETSAFYRFVHASM